MIVATKTIGEDFDIVVVDHDPEVTSTAACAGCMIIQHTTGVIRWFTKLTDGDNTDVEIINRHCNYSATTAPGVSDDSIDGYSIGSEWLDTVTGKWYKCRGSATGAAVWDVLN